jgi:hypothetical protein
MTRRSDAWRRVFMTLAVLALAVKVAIPAGFMAAPRLAQAPFALVLCTGQGAMVLGPDGALHRLGEPAKAPDGKSGHDAPCAFAGHGQGALTAALAGAAPVSFVAYRLARVPEPPDLAPGRGLAAPPPPNRGPPVQSA